MPSGATHRNPKPSSTCAPLPREVSVTEPRTTDTTDTTAEAVAAAIGRLTGDSDSGGATAADIAAAAHVAYSTTNKKLRALRDAGRATSSEGPDKRTRWRLTTAAPADTLDGGGPQAPDPAVDARTEPDPHPAPAAATADSDPQTASVDEPVDDGSASTDPLPGPTQATNPDTDRPGEAEPAAAPADPPGTADSGGASAGTLRRPSGSLRGAILDVLEADPGRQYKVGELCKLIDRASEGSGYVNVGAGAVFNAVIKLVGEHRVMQTVDKPATFQIAAQPTAD